MQTKSTFKVPRHTKAELLAGMEACMTYEKGHADGLKDALMGYDLSRHFIQQPEFYRGYRDGWTKGNAKRSKTV